MALSYSLELRTPLFQPSQLRLTHLWLMTAMHDRGQIGFGSYDLVIVEIIEHCMESSTAIHGEDFTEATR
jgi:hypothetical protein